MILTAFTLLHVLISLVAIATGFVVVGGWLAGQHLSRWTTWFLATTTATSVTGFFFPYRGFTPAYVFGVLSLLVLGAAYYALHTRHLTGGWRTVYVITAIIALYLNFFILIVQMFRKVPVLHALAPTQSEPPFGIAQGVALLLFVVLAFLATRRFRHDPAVS